MVQHHEMVAALVKPGVAILETLTAEKVGTWHMAAGIVGEAGELSEAVKKHVAYNKPLDRENVIEELGDLEFYMEGLRQSLGITRDETLTHNIAKLSVRYAGLQYTDAAAHNRVDKA
jgi:NTP pyrophosphatase (non-canonical NTP hydrolase)